MMYCPQFSVLEVLPEVFSDADSDDNDLYTTMAKVRMKRVV